MSIAEHAPASRRRFVAVLLLAACCASSCGKKGEGPGDHPPGFRTFGGDGYVDPPPVGTYPSSEAVIQGWINAVDMASIRAHGWSVWASITSATSMPDVPVWETWYSGHELFEMDTLAPKLRKQQGRMADFERPSQFHHQSVLASIRRRGLKAIPRDSTEQITSFNRYTASLASFIWNNKLNRAATFNDTNTWFDAHNTPVANRAIQTSADSVDAKSIALKPVFQFIDGTHETVLPYWNGTTSSAASDSLNPTVATWKQAVVIDPTGKLKPGTTVQRSVNGGPPVPCRVVALQDFYFIKLSQADVESFSQFALESGDDVGQNNKTDSADLAAMVKAGNYALLVAMHVTTKEIPNWTWQTFYWAADPNDSLTGRDRPASIKGPWSHYNMLTAYFMVTPPGQPTGAPFIAFNPYLETNLAGTIVQNGDSVNWTGIESNCMSCHRMAAWRQNPGQSFPLTPPYHPNGQIMPGDSALFGGFTKLDFLWSLTRAN